MPGSLVRGNCTWQVDRDSPAGSWCCPAKSNPVIRAEFAFGIVFIDIIVGYHVGIEHLGMVFRTDGTYHGIAPNPFSVGCFPYRIGAVSRVRVELADVFPDAEYHPVGFRIGA